LFFNCPFRSEWLSYDSVGATTLSGDRIDLCKDTGRMDEVKAARELVLSGYLPDDYGRKD
jgi:hypothetical protein